MIVKSFEGRDEFCIRVTSSSSNCRSNTFSGNPITLFQNDVEKTTIPNGFTDFEYCLDNDEVDAKNDKFKLLSGGIDGVSVYDMLHVECLVNRYVRYV